MEKFPVINAKKEKYIELFHGEPEAIFVFSGDIVKNESMDIFPAEFGEENAEYRSSAVSDLDPFGHISGGMFRVVAAAKAAEQFPKAKIVTVSRDKEASPGRPSHASVMADELTRRRVGRERIILEENSISTATEIREMLILAAKMGWKKIAVITSGYHIPRAEKIFEITRVSDEKGLLKAWDDRELQESLQNLKDTEFIFISEEQILAGAEGGTWKVVFDKLKKSNGYLKRLAIEQQGVKDLAEGTYGTKK